MHEIIATVTTPLLDLCTSVVLLIAAVERLRGERSKRQQNRSKDSE
ncbi:hypothetical protein [Lentzea sp. CC55]|nr:hypothetical protein [Lentzea sp. CC55]MCG8924152.1 hypothetical protein [Lentzea sp. CC55]